MTRKWLFLLTALLPLGAMAVEVSEAVVRGLPPGQKNTAAFFTLNNPSTESVVLRPGSSDIAERLEIHSNTEHNGMMAMRREERLVLAPGQSLSFAPGGYHLMLINLRRPLQHGEELSFSLLVDGKPLQVLAPVRSVLSEGAPSGHHHH